MSSPAARKTREKSKKQAKKAKATPYQRRQKTARIVSVAALAAMLITTVLAGAAGAASENTGRTPFGTEDIDAALGRAQRIGTLFRSPEAADKLRIAVLRQMTTPAPLPPAPRTIPDPGEVDMGLAWEGDSGQQTLDADLDRRVTDFVRSAGTASTLRNSSGQTPAAPAGNGTSSLTEGGTPTSGNASQSGPSAGPITCPVQGDLRFINDWGFPRSGGRTHRGNDLFALEGTLIVAVRDAIVTSVSRVDRGLGGLHVSYIDDRGDRWYNAHLSKVADGIHPGTEVKRGEIVGYVGRTGNARTTPPHNHIQWHPQNGQAANPYYTLRPACR